MSGIRNNPRPNTLIIMYVDTNGLTQENILDHIWMADTSGDTANDSGGRISNYESKVQKGGNITWVGVVLNPITAPGVYVIITDIRNPDGTPISNNIFANLKHQPSQTPGAGGTHMNAKVASNPPTNDPIQYRIYFHVHTIDEHGVDSSQPFNVDPVLRIH